MRSRARVVVLLAWLAGGCGRLGFDSGAAAGADPDAGSVAAAADATAAADARAVCIPQVEVCNGIDDSCDGEIDEGCPCQPFDVIVPGVGNDGPRRIAWTGTSYALLLDHGTTTDLTILDPTGAVITSRTLGTAAYEGVNSQVGVVWTGAELVAIWTDDEAKFWLARFSAAGVPVGPPIALDAQPRAMAWAEDRLVLASLEPTSVLSVRELALDGTTLREGKLALPPNPVTSIESLAVTRDAYAIMALEFDNDGAYVRVDRAAWTLDSWLLPVATPDFHVAGVAARPDGTVALVDSSDGITNLRLFRAGVVPTGLPILVPPNPANDPAALTVTPVQTGFRVSLSSFTEAWNQTFDLQSQTFSPVEQAALYPPLDGVTTMASLGVSGRQALTLTYLPKGNGFQVRMIQTCR